MENECNWYDPACFMQWLQEELKALAVWLYDSLLEGAIAMIDLIPMPDFLTDLQPITLSSGVSWVAESFELEFGVGVIVSAYIARFLVRRIPIIG